MIMIDFIIVILLYCIVLYCYIVIVILLCCYCYTIASLYCYSVISLYRNYHIINYDCYLLSIILYLLLYVLFQLLFWDRYYVVMCMYSLIYGTLLRNLRGIQGYSPKNRRQNTDSSCNDMASARCTLLFFLCIPRILDPPMEGLEPV